MSWTPYVVLPNKRRRHNMKEARGRKRGREREKKVSFVLEEIRDPACKSGYRGTTSIQLLGRLESLLCSHGRGESRLPKFRLCLHTLDLSQMTRKETTVLYCTVPYRICRSSTESLCAALHTRRGPLGGKRVTGFCGHPGRYARQLSANMRRIEVPQTLCVASCMTAANFKAALPCLKFF